jgi:hypothetical protein
VSENAPDTAPIPEKTPAAAEPERDEDDTGGDTDDVDGDDSDAPELPGERGGMPKWFLILGMFYTILLGIVLGKLALKLIQHRPEPAPVTQLDTAAAEFVLAGSMSLPGGSVQVELAPPYSQLAHGRKLIEQALKDMGLPTNQYLVELRVGNGSRTESVSIEDVEGLVAIADEKMVGMVSLPLPDPATAKMPEAARLRLIQKKPTGEIPPESARRFWVLMPTEPDFGKARNAFVRFVGGREAYLLPEKVNNGGE